MLIIISISVNAVCDNARNLVGDGIDAADIDAGDLDGDGDIDVVAAMNNDNNFKWFRNNGQGAFTSILLGTHNFPEDVVIVDVDGDGDNDIGGVSQSDNNFLLWTNDGTGTFVETEEDNTVTSARSISAGDIDGDGDIDFIIGRTGGVTIEENDGSESFTNTIVGGATSTNYVQLVDMDLDGDLDILAVRSTTDTIVWMENFGSLNFQVKTLTTTLNDALHIDAGDIDGDGDIDVVAASSTETSPNGIESVMQWFQNDGVMGFTKINITTNITFDGIDTIIIEDVDNDGDNDLIVSDFQASDFIAVFVNDGNELFTHINITNAVTTAQEIRFADVTGDGLKDIIYADIGDDEIEYIDMSRCEEITSLQFQSCDFPTLFCDNFDYNIPLMSNTENRWLIQLGAGQMNNTFAPIDNKLALTNLQNIFPFHATEPFDVSYRPDSGSRFTKHFLSPVFSSEFTLNFANVSDNQFFYSAFELQFKTAYSIKAEISTDGVGNSSGNMNWFYLNESQPSTNWKTLCFNCTNAEDDIFIKINSFFQQREDFPFNSSVDDDEIRIFANNILLGTIEDYLDPRVIGLKQYEFGKLSNSNYTIDDYFVMVGTDTQTSTFEQYFTDKFINDTVLIDDVPDGEIGDMAVAINTIWDDMGLQSVASKLTAGLFLMFFLAMLMVGMAFKTNHPISARVIIVVELFFMILLVFVKLLPIWLPFVIVIIAAGIGAFVAKLGTQT